MIKIIIIKMKSLFRILLTIINYLVADFRTIMIMFHISQLWNQNYYR
jgi:hypothetical protein